MKNIRKVLVVFAMLALCLAFSGCTVFETDTEALMRPPVFSEEQAKLNEALSAVIGENYSLKYPASGGANSAFIFRDLDEDGTDEAMAFYSTEDNNTRINILKSTGEGWVSVYEAAGFSGDIESIEFADIDEKSPAVVIKWAFEIGIYRFEGNRLERIHGSECYGSDIEDMDGDGYSDIIIFKGTNMDRSMLNVFHSHNEKTVLTEDVATHAEYGEIYSSSVGKLGDGRMAYFLDSEIYEGVYLTEFLTLEDNKVIEHTIDDFVEDETAEQEEEDESGIIVIVGGNLGKRRIFTRNTPVGCMDINGDGIMEFPVEVREDYAREASDKVYYLEYMQYDGTNSSAVWHGIANAEAGYLFSVPEFWNSAAEAVIDSSSGELRFKSIESGETILKIHSVLKSDYQDKYENYILAAENGEYNYYIEALAPEESKFYTDPAEFENCFTFI
ncbi:MAG: hypothetical protein IJ945_07575 [Oscillospiraceae bacterium]|nr:hypothetical protein [Oscillospiraceae bacterium]